MRAAGYHVRVMPREDLGWEENPPTLLEFMRRDLRWCQGNMQYWRFLLLPNLRPVSRYQLVLAILMFIGSPAWIGLLVLATIALVLCDDPATIMRSDAGSALLTWVLVMWFSPKIAGALDVLLSPEERRAFGGAGRFTVNFVIETVYSIVLCPILWISHTIFLFGLLFNREISWMGQVRDDHAVPLTLALRDLWPQTLVGCASLGLVLASQPWASAVHSPACRRAGLVGPVCDGDGLACARQPCSPYRHRPASRGDGNPGGSSGVGVARDQFGEPAASGKLGLANARRRQDRARHHQVVSYLLRRQAAGCGDGPALWQLRPARRSGVRRRRPCRRPRRLVPPAGRTRRRGRAAAGHGQGAQAALWPQQIRCDRGGGGGARAGQGAHADQCR